MAISRTVIAAAIACTILVCAGAVSTRALLDKPCPGTATYSILNDCEWNAQKFPRDYPAGDAHWSPLCGTAHTDQASLFKVGEPASDGVKEVAETGACTILDTEIATCVAGGNCQGPISIPCDPFSGTCKQSGTITLDGTFHYVTLASMIAPSPDWMVGVDSVNLCVDGKWVDSWEKDLMALDAGTDAGTTFAAADNALEPRAPISVLDAKDDSNIFYNSDAMNLYPLCKITMTKTGTR